MRTVGQYSRSRARFSIALLLALAATLVAGCGSSDNGVASKAPKEIVAASKKAAEEATSVHVTGKTSDGPLALTLSIDYAENGGKGQIALGPLKFEVIRVGDTLYVKGDKAFIAGLTRTTGTHLPEGRWIKASVNGSQFSQLAAFVSKNKELALMLNNGAVLSKGETTTLNGQKAVQVKQVGKLFTGKLYVATTGKPFPLQLEKSGRETGKTTFTNWNKPVTVTAPSDAVELSKL